MQQIENVTIGIDWEILVNSQNTGLSAGKERILQIISEAKRKLPDLEVGEDIDLLEVRLGMTSDFAELWEKSHRAFETCSKLAARKKATLVPLGYREADYNPAGGHVHAGSMQNYIDTAELHNRLLPFVPALISIASSSPSLDGRTRSQRIKMNAHHCSNPMTPMDPERSLHLWGTDVCVKYPYKPTLELRAADSQPIPAMVCEIAALYAGLASGLSRRDKPVFKSDVLQYGLNRINAARNGMRATFRMGDSEITASEIIAEYILPIAVDGLNDYGAPDGPFAIAETMVRNRISIADWVETLVPSGTDPFRAVGELTRIFSVGVDPVGWIARQKPRQAAPFIGPEDDFLEAVAIDTPIHHVYEALPLPRSYIESMAEDFEKAGKIRRRKGKRNEFRLDRTDLLQ